ncbi:acyl-CoA dehydrogenase family protein [Streptomyces sp. NPDC008137]|uniref:acyl-CoA dehydrogenase family protein n=1 Tax=Streptomyces sp. NPDC008137 TaxID=3364813 RepID=UPI0036E34366
MTDTSTASSTTSARTELLERASKIAPLLRDNAAEAERSRRLPDANVEAMSAEGFFSLRTPARFGGLETDLRTYTDVVARIAGACGSSGWIAFISNATAWVVSSAFGEQALREVFGGNPSTRFIGLLAPTATSRRVEGGHAVTGRWGFASNSSHADWAMLTAPLEDEDGDVSPHLILAPMTELTVVDTWFVAGMAGTGSNTVETGGEVFVPTHRTVPFGRVLSGRTQSESSHQSVPQRENFVISAVHMVGAPVIGMARAALDVTLERLRTPKPISYTFYTDTRDAPSTQLNIAKAATLIDTAEMLLQWWADETVGAASEGREFDALARARFRANFGYAMECCRDATKLLLNVQGASAFATTNPVQRIWRDLETASRHGLLNYEFGQEVYSRSLLGIEEPIGVLV